MRPIKEIFMEEYWNIAYRKITKGEYVFLDKNKKFNALKESKRYWYADPFLFEHNNEVFLFVEAFDNVVEKGLIAYAKFNGEGFDEPEIVLEENFHLSYPLVFEEENEIFMMPETMHDGRIQLYKAIDFPKKWERYKTLVVVDNAVDTVRHGDNLITSITVDPIEKTTDVNVYDLEGKLVLKGLKENSQVARGAGDLFVLEDKIIRPAQDSTGGIYGAGLVFYNLKGIGKDYEEEKIYTLTPSDFLVRNKKTNGVHTYARCEGLEVIDYKSKRINFRRILWILKKKLSKTIGKK